MHRSRSLGCFVALLAAASPAAAQFSGERIVRVGAGAQVRPAYPGADKLEVGPFFDLSFRKEGEVFVFEAPDESFGLSLVDVGGLEFGPSLNIQGSRNNEDVGAPVGKVKTTIEAGGFVQFQAGPSLRFRAEGRKGLGGHDGLVGELAADYILRDGDRYLFSIGPRVTLSDSDYQRAYFGVTPAVAAATGLPAFQPDGGVHAVGATAGLLYQFTPRWGISTFVKYDRLVSDAARSPIVRTYGSRDQYSGGLAPTYTFGGGGG